MNAATVLKFNESEINDCPYEYIEELTDKWIEAYREIAEKYPDKKHLCEYLMARVILAAQIQSLAVDEEETDSVYVQTYDMDILNEMEADERLLDGDFPLGSGDDAEFAVQYFPIKQLALIQCGLADTIELGEFYEPDYNLLVRKGFLAELKGEWKLAEMCYGGVPFDDEVIQRGMSYCRTMKLNEGNRCYKEAEKLKNKGREEERRALLARAAEMDNTDAMTILGLEMLMSCGDEPANTEEAVKLLKKSASAGSRKAFSALSLLFEKSCEYISEEEFERLKKKFE